MVSLAKTVLVKSVLKCNTHKLLLIPIRTLVEHKHWKPGPYPETEEERKKAAEKYNLPAELYEPYPDDGFGYGDYPKLPIDPVDGRDPFYPYDYPSFRRNYGETISVDDAIYREDRHNAAYRDVVPMWSMWLQFFGFMGIMASIFLFLEPKERRFENPWLEKQYPLKGKVHYSFEPK